MHLGYTLNNFDSISRIIILCILGFTFSYAVKYVMCFTQVPGLFHTLFDSTLVIPMHPIQPSATLVTPSSQGRERQMGAVSWHRSPYSFRQTQTAYISTIWGWFLWQLAAVLPGTGPTRRGQVARTVTPWHRGCCFSRGERGARWLRAQNGVSSLH